MERVLKSVVLFAVLGLILAGMARTEEQSGTTDKSQEKPAAKPAETTTMPEVVVTASRVPTPAEQTGISVSTVKAEVIEITQHNSASELLQYVPGVTTATTGTLGSQTSLFVRGGNSNQTEILFDGWKVNQQGGYFDFAGLDPLALDRIEVARGPASTLYGSDAMTGAVNLVTAKGSGPPTLTTSAAGGTYGTERETVALTGQEKKFSYNVASSHLGQHDGPYINSDVGTYSYAVRLDYDINPDHSLKLIARGHDLSKGWYENTATGYGPGAEPQDPNDKLHNRDWLVGLEYRGQVLPIWQTALRMGQYGIDLGYDSILPNPPSPWMSAPYNTAIPGTTNSQQRRDTVDWQNNILAYEAPHIRNTVTLGFCAEYESFKQQDTIYAANFDVSHTNCAEYFQNRLELYDRVFLTGGLRQEQNAEFCSFTTARGDAVILIPESNTRLHGSLGNAFRAPSFYELYAAGMGNANLSPEQNLAWDAGLEQHFWKERISLGATYFHNSFDKLISFDFAANHFENIATASSRGAEAFFTIKPVKEIELQSTATFLHTEDAVGRRLLRRPPQTYTSRLILRPLMRLVPEKHAGLEIALSAIHVGDRTDIGPTAANSYARVTNPGYTRLDMAVSYRFLEHFRAFVRVDNVTNERYESAKTFPAASEQCMGGLEDLMEIINEARKGYVHVYTGEGKGKTTAALGLVLRAVGAGYRVLIVQFMKGMVYSEIKALGALSDRVEVKQYGRSECFVGKQPSQEDSDWAARGLREAIEALRTRQYDLVVFDELAVAQSFNLVTVEDVMALLRERPPETEVVITGRWAHPAIVAQADLVTDMREVKHYYRKGVMARVGIER